MLLLHGCIMTFLTCHLLAVILSHAQFSAHSRLMHQVRSALAPPRSVAD